jgi:hypothetical protein
MTSWQGSSEDRPTGAAGAFRAVFLVAVCLGLAALAAATFVLSYQGIRTVALQAGIEPRYASDYPLLIDAMLLIALAAVLALRGAGLPSRMLSWLTLLVVFCAAAGADTLHARGRTLPHNAAIITAAVLPWALMFVAFVLLLAMLRHARLRRHLRAALAEPAWPQPVADGQSGRQQILTAPPPPPPPAAPLPVRSPQPWHEVSIVPGFSSQLVSSAVAGAAAGAAAADVELPVYGGEPPDDADSQIDGAGQEPTAVETQQPVTTAAADDDGDETGAPGDDIGPAGTEDDVPELLAESAVQTDEAEPQADEAPSAHTAEDGQSADEAQPPADEAQPLADEAQPPADEAQPPADEAQPLADEAQPLADEAQPLADEAQPLADEDDEDDEMPVFHRIWSSPTPPEE